MVYLTQYCSYVNDLPEEFTKGNIWLFADDVCHIVNDRGKQPVINNAQQGLYEVRGWCKQYKLALNRGKTEALTFNNRRKPDCLPFTS